MQNLALYSTYKMRSISTLISELFKELSKGWVLAKGQLSKCSRIFGLNDECMCPQLKS